MLYGAQIGASYRLVIRDAVSQCAQLNFLSYVNVSVMGHSTFDIISTLCPRDDVLFVPFAYIYEVKSSLNYRGNNHN